MQIKAMKKIILLFITLSIATGLYSQKVDMSQVSLNLSDRTKPYLGKEVIDTIGTCKAVRDRLDSIMLVGVSAFDDYDGFGHERFNRHYHDEIENERKKLLSQYVPQAVIDAENEYQNILQEATNMKQSDISRYYTYDSKYEPKPDLLRLVPKALVKLRQTYCSDMNNRPNKNPMLARLNQDVRNKIGITNNNKIEAPNLGKLSKALQKELPKNKEEIIKELTQRVLDSKKDELLIPAENNVLRNYLKQLIDRMPPIDSPNCFNFIHNSGGNTIKDLSISYVFKTYTREGDIYKKYKKKIITWKNPNYFKEDNSWNWLSIKNGNESWREHVEKHYPVEDSYDIDKRHPECQIRYMPVINQYILNVSAAFVGDTLKGVSNEFAYDYRYIDPELEKVLCFYELEHNKYNINAEPTYVKDCIRYVLVEFCNNNSHDNSFEYKKNHKYETEEKSEQYIMQLHLDHKDLAKSFNKTVKEFKYKRTERVDGTTFRYYIGDKEQIVILQKFVYGNYCWHLFPYSKITTFSPQDYVINKEYINREKVLTCYYVVEKYE